ncbi:Gfo/Idh/MocA family protein [Streptomyces sp. NPDC020917]|uniref:Gfo/Idh/MocA family protein n=1 Tax=Streptomyces sp. NPDC020917 TaxID=3365102 RepID=UPI0037A80CA1
MTRTVVLAGASGYGRTYLQEIAALEAAGAVRLAGVCDVRPLDAEGRALAGDRPFDTDLGRLLDRTRPDIGIVATPIHTHLPLARQVLGAGAHLLVEKPPLPTAEDWRELVRLGRAADRVCQTGFQSLGSQAVVRLGRLMAEGRFGRIRGIGGYGAWSRPNGYYRRAAWAGRREVDGRPVVDGALTNPFAHMISTALQLDASTGWDDVDAVELELFHARDIQADDTSCVRLRTGHGTVVTAAVTLCAETAAAPVLMVYGTHGHATLHYTTDLLAFDGMRERHSRTSPLQNLLAHLDDDRVPLQSGLDACGGFMRVLEAVRTAPDPLPIDPAWVRHSDGEHGDGGGDDASVQVIGVEAAVRASAERLATFGELGVPWAPAPASRP